MNFSTPNGHSDHPMASNGNGHGNGNGDASRLAVPPLAAQPTASPDEVDLTRLLTPIKRHWKRVVLVWLVVMALAAVYLSLSRPAFTSESTLLVETQSAGASNAFSALQLMSGDNQLSTMQALIQSPRVVSAAARRAGLNVSISGPAEHLWPEIPFYSWVQDKDPLRFQRGLYATDVADSENQFHSLGFTIAFSDAQQFEVIRGDTVLAEARLGEPVALEGAGFTVMYAGGPDIKPGTTFQLSIQPLHEVTQDIIEVITVQEVSAAGVRVSMPTNMMKLTYTAGDPFAAQRFVDALFEVFLSLNRDWATANSRSIVKFVDSQIARTELQLQEAAEVLAAFQSESGIINPESQSQLEVERLIATESGYTSTKLMLHTLKRLDQAIKEQQDVTPIALASESPAIKVITNRLIDLENQLASGETTLQAGHPTLTALKEQRRILMDDLRSTVGKQLIELEANLADQAALLQDMESRIAHMPEQMVAWANFERAAATSEQLYLFLAQQQNQAKIMEASTLSNLRWVDYPQVPHDHAQPQARTMLALAGMLGLVLGLCVAVLPAVFTKWFEALDDIKAALPNQPIFAVLPYRGQKIRRAVPDTIDPDPTSPFSEAIRLLRTNLLHARTAGQSQTILLSSAIPGDGKTSVSTNLAAALARSPKVDRVLLIDADMHRPSLHDIFKLPSTPGLSSVLSGETQRDEAIRTVDLGRGATMDIMTAGYVPLTPSDLIESNAMAELLDYASGHYTYVLIDCPPFPLLPTTSTLAPRADRVLSVCRLGHTERAIFLHHVHELSLRNRHTGLVVNASAQFSSGYGAKYGSYGQQYRAKTSQAHNPSMSRLVKLWPKTKSKPKPTKREKV